MVPAHFAEVATRNAVDEVLTSVYGDRWPWSTTFEVSLPDPGQGYSPRRDLRRCRSQQPSTGKVIAELKFVFWQKMFTARHDARLWRPSIATLFPAAPLGLPPAQLRSRVYEDLEAIRRVRNRIAHHEPIFSRDLPEDLRLMLELVDLRSPETGRWTRALEDASHVLAERP